MTETSDTAEERTAETATNTALEEVLSLSDEALVAFVDFVRFNDPKFTRDPAIIRRVLNAYASLSKDPTAEVPA